MPRMLNVAIPVTLLFSALVLSACASKPEPVAVVEPAQAAAVPEKPSVPEATPETAPVAVAIAEQPAASKEPAPMPATRKPRKITAKHAAPKAVAHPPVMAPVPVVEQPAPPVLPPEPSSPLTVPPPVEKVAEAGFLERYWLWLLGLAIVIAGVFVWLWRGQEGKH
jgi:hypothetical protein